jgi:hypothetical protein
MTNKGVDPWRKAADCEAHAQATNNGKMQQAFRKLRDSWIRVGNDAQLSADVEANARRLDDAERS